MALGIGHIIELAVVLLLVFWVYLLFTQPQNALYVAERILTAVWRVLYTLLRGLYVIINSIVKLIARLIKR